MHRVDSFAQMDSCRRKHRALGEGEDVDQMKRVSEDEVWEE